MQTNDLINTDALKDQLIQADPDPNSERVTLREMIMKYLTYWPLFFVLFTLMVGAAYLYIRYSNPVYNTSIEVLVKDDEKKEATTSPAPSYRSCCSTGSPISPTSWN